MGKGKMMVEFFSTAMLLRVCRYRSWRAEGDSAIIREASFRALEAFISPSAAMICSTDREPLFPIVLTALRGNSPNALFTFALASRLASASAAMALCSWWGNFTSLISTRSTLIPHRSVASSRDSWENIKSQILQSYKTLLVMLHSNNYKMRSSTPEVYVALWPSWIKV